MDETVMRPDRQAPYPVDTEGYGAWRWPVTSSCASHTAVPQRQPVVTFWMQNLKWRN